MNRIYFLKACNQPVGRRLLTVVLIRSDTVGDMWIQSHDNWGMYDERHYNAKVNKARLGLTRSITIVAGSGELIGIYEKRCIVEIC